MAENGETHRRRASWDRTHTNVNAQMRFILGHALRIKNWLVSYARTFVIEVEAVERAPIAELK